MDGAQLADLAAEALAARRQVRTTLAGYTPHAQPSVLVALQDGSRWRLTVEQLAPAPPLLPPRQPAG